jgi:hypothetical protein
LLVRVRMATRLLSTLCRVEQFLRDNSQIRHVRGLPVLFGVRTRQALSSVWIFDHPHLVPDKPTCVELVLNEACAALHIAIDCRGVPRASARRRYSFLVQVVGNFARSPPANILLKNSPDDLCFSFDNCALSLVAGNWRIPVSPPACIEPLSNTTRQSPAHLVGVVLAIELAHQSAKSNQNCVDDPLVDGADFDSKK